MLAGELISTLTAAAPEIVREMLSCEQTSGQNMLQHGLSVARRMDDCVKSLSGEGPSLEWSAPPEWLTRAWVGRMVSRETWLSYAVLHDCGKPRVRILDEAGRVHYPRHAFVSAEVYREAGGESDVVETLIRRDMDIHTLAAADVEQFIATGGVTEAATLWVAGWAEIHANAAMFGGFESTSFKIKRKHLLSRGKALAARIL